MWWVYTKVTSLEHGTRKIWVALQILTIFVDVDIGYRMFLVL